ncbi:MAG: glycoside hydrolase family 88 protein [Tannerellaceae bacterium]|nr:glycoside hydrolase family 88 protein [Tannerellaceae bacterium]
MTKKMYILCMLFVCATYSFTYGQQQALTGFPPGNTPEEVGNRIAQRYLSEPFRNFDGNPSPPSEVIYPEVCAWFGALKFAHITKDTQLVRQLEERFLPLLGAQKELMQVPDHVDHTVFGAVPLQLYLQTGNECYYYIGIDFADRQWQLPAGTKHREEYQSYLDEGLSWQTRYWIDDMFMITTIQSQAFLASGDEKYINRAARQMTAYLDSIQRSNGLFYHAGEAPFYWCRGNGWMAAGMTDLLTYLPRENEQYDRILSQYRKMMNTLKEYCKEDGLWGQLVDDRNSWTETSGSAMFTYAMINGVKNGWLDEDTYGPIARKAWLALQTFINEENDLTEVCMGTNTGTTRQYYLDRRRITGDLHGQAPLLWCAAALLE